MHAYIYRTLIPKPEVFFWTLIWGFLFFWGGGLGLLVVEGLVCSYVARGVCSKSQQMAYALAPFIFFFHSTEHILSAILFTPDYSAGCRHEFWTWVLPALREVWRECQVHELANLRYATTTATLFINDTNSNNNDTDDNDTNSNSNNSTKNKRLTGTCVTN